MAIALGPAAFIAWISGARRVFVAGAVGAMAGLTLAPHVMFEFNSYPTERDLILLTISVDAPWTCSGAFIGSSIGAITVLLNRRRPDSIVGSPPS